MGYAASGSTLNLLDFDIAMRGLAVVPQVLGKWFYEPVAEMLLGRSACAVGMMSLVTADDCRLKASFCDFGRHVTLLHDVQVVPTSEPRNDAFH